MATPGRVRSRAPNPAAGPHRVASGSAARIGRARLALHVCVGVLGWLGLAALWIWQLAVYVPSDWLRGLELIAVILGAFALLVPAWVAWNRNIYRRRHARLMPRSLSVDFSHDRLGRTVVGGPGVLSAGGEIRVRVDPLTDVKTYAALRSLPDHDPARVRGPRVPRRSLERS
jgi:hypothetical protein